MVSTPSTVSLPLVLSFVKINIILSSQGDLVSEDLPTMQSSVGLLVLIECQYRSDLSAFTNKNSECKHSGLRSRLGCRQKIHNYFRFLPTEYNKQSFYANM